MTLSRFSSYLLLLVAISAGCGRAPSESSDASVGSRSSIAEASANANADEAETGLTQARRLIASNQFDAARDKITQHLRTHPRDPVALQMAGDGAIQANDFVAAAKHYESATKNSAVPSKELWLKWAGATIRDERPFDTIAILRDAVAVYPDTLELRQNLATFLARVGLQDQAAEHLQWMVQRKYGSQSVLFILSDLTRSQTLEATCQSALVRHPDDLRPVFSIAQKGVTTSAWENIRQSLAPVVTRHPDFLPAIALYGRSLVELSDDKAVQRWSQSLPAGIEAYPHYWLAAGNWSSRHGANEQAAHAYWSAVRLNENDAESLSGLSIALHKLDRSSEAKLAARRAEKIAALRGHVATLEALNFDSQKAVVEISLALQELGRIWEAANWLVVGQSMKQHPDPRLQKTYLDIRAELNGATPWQSPLQWVSTKMDLSTLPRVVWHPNAGATRPLSEEKSRGTMGFRDESVVRLLDHVCEIGKPKGDESGLMIYQSGAGGAGVIDFDLDGWPDVYLTVMDGTPGRSDSQPNRLHRNVAGTFSDVTDRSTLVDHGFAQGISVGDYNADGWPDVYVANIGRNRLYRNNGDGTFCDVTAQCGIDGSGWTTSVAIADLDSDGNADIYEVGYCRGERPLAQECIVESFAESRSCNPMAFDPESDRIWSGNGDGTFADATHWFGAHKPGRGFALVVGDLDHDPGLETYVANDMTANHYWDQPADGDPFELSEQAAIRGLALNRQSIAQASMGIAAADADSDGDIDFFLTHFVDDHNTYYQQHRAGIWSDESHAAGFVESSRPMLAYGTQWIDVDNDGLLDVFVANGDIDDFRFEDRPFRQPAQLLKQTTRGRWQPVKGRMMGDYFTKDRLARAVATLDVNRDGKSDLMVTHLFDPVALLINRSDTTAKQTRFTLRARSTHRDAIGARVRFTVDEKAYEQQLLAGNGFQCVNEACVVFGVSDAESLEGVQVIWPGGSSELLGDLSVGGDFLVVQGLGASPLLP